MDGSDVVALRGSDGYFGSMTTALEMRIRSGAERVELARLEENLE
ncbi:hypothetical protein [Actinocorallia libanotica]|uniref:DUF5753 domain-containing protein n=1 Tax=Actinocorallia libanotica TaxID=46162 RepID=A0ABP4C9M4_9ACTN